VLQAEGAFPRLGRHGIFGLQSLPLDSTAQAVRANLLAWRPRRRSCELGHPANQAKSYGRYVPLDAQYGCSCAMDQDLAQVQVIALAHTEQVRLAFGRVLLRHDAEPCSELPPSAKVVHTAM